MIIVSDSDCPHAYPEKIGDQDVVVRPLAELKKIPPVLVVDVDLKDLEKVAFLRRQLMNPPGIVAVTADLTSHHARTQAYALGATTLLPKPLSVHDLETMIEREMATMHVDETCRSSVLSAADSLEDSFAALRANTNLALPQIRRSSEDIIDAIMERGMVPWLNTVRLSHKSTFQHCLVVTGVATAFGHGTGMSRRDVAMLTATALLHDIGKVHIPQEILDKPGGLSDEEIVVMRRHPVIGYDYLVGQGKVSSDTLSAVRHHHEYLDGSGYPDGLSGGEIDDLTRILTVCDIYGALVELRAYKPPKKPQEAIDVLEVMSEQGKVEKALVRALARVVHLEQFAI